MDALGIISFGNQNRIARLGGVGSLLDGLPGGVGGSIARIIAPLGVNV
jgi:hypothetical protein